MKTPLPQQCEVLRLSAHDHPLKCFKRNSALLLPLCLSFLQQQPLHRTFHSAVKVWRDSLGGTVQDKVQKVVVEAVRTCAGVTNRTGVLNLQVSPRRLMSLDRKCKMIVGETKTDERGRTAGIWVDTSVATLIMSSTAVLQGKNARYHSDAKAGRKLNYFRLETAW